ncbi:MAG: luciferase family protein [Pseudomonadota bacterium]
MIDALKLERRNGSKPDTTSSLPHMQLTQHGPDEIVEQLHAWAFSLTGVRNEASGISVPGARALVMHEAIECNHAAFMVGREFAHIHPHPDSGSMHVVVPPEDASEIVEKGWGEDHYLVTAGSWPHGLVMIFSPRTREELETVKTILKRSYDFALEPRD